MKKLRLFDSLKFVRFVVAVVAATFILNVAHADTSINSVIAYGKTEQSATPTPTTPVPIMTNNGVLKVRPNLWNGIITNFAYTSTSTEVIENAAYSGIVVEVVPGQTYTFARASAIGNRFVYFFTKEYPKVGMPAYGVVSGTSITTLKKTFTVPAEMKYVVFYFDTTGTNIIESKMRLVQGTSADEVYVDGLTETIRDSAGHTATAQMLLGINDTYRDEQNINTGAITRKVRVKVLTGYEDGWSRNSDRASLSITDILNGSDSWMPICTHYKAYHGGTSLSNMDDNSCKITSGGKSLLIKDTTHNTSLTDFTDYIKAQYAAGTPVIVVYPLATETTENVATQTLTTAPVRQTAGSILGMPIEVILSDNTSQWVNDAITIATTKYNEESFAPVKTDLSAAVNAVEYVVSNTMTQAQQIDQIATNKQTRPDESCPPFKKCLLVEDEDGTPHWYEIYDPINDFLNPILAAAALSGNQGAPTQTTHSDGSNTIIDTSNIFYNGSGAFRKNI